MRILVPGQAASIARTDSRGKAARRELVCAVLLAIPATVFHEQIRNLWTTALQDDRYSHVLLIPVISAILLFSGRRSIFSTAPAYSLAGLPLMTLGLALRWPVGFIRDGNDALACGMLGLALAWVGAFLFCFGRKAARAATFPLGFLILMIPLPTALLNAAVNALQHSSAAVTGAVFAILRIPARWEALSFTLNGYGYEIAVECSGIRSCMGLLVVSIVAGYLLLRSMWARVVFALLTIAAAIFKNAVRIVTVSWLTSYVDKSYYTSWIHTSGGVLFSLAALAILIPSLLGLQRMERSHSRQIR